MADKYKWVREYNSQKQSFGGSEYKLLAKRLAKANYKKLKAIQLTFPPRIGEEEALVRLEDKFLRKVCKSKELEYVSLELKRTEESYLDTPVFPLKKLIRLDTLRIICLSLYCSWEKKRIAWKWVTSCPNLERFSISSDKSHLEHVVGVIPQCGRSLLDITSLSLSTLNPIDAAMLFIGIRRCKLKEVDFRIKNFTHRKGVDRSFLTGVIRMSLALFGRSNTLNLHRISCVDMMMKMRVFPRTWFVEELFPDMNLFKSRPRNQQ